MDERLKQQLEFVLEIDKEKNIEDYDRKSKAEILKELDK